MPKFYEIIFETGNYSIAMYDDDDEAIRAISEHHKRAKSGEPAQLGSPEQGSAERIVKVLKYDQHPADYKMDGTATPEEITAAVNKAIDEKSLGGIVSVEEVALAVKEVSDSVEKGTAPHESNYKMKEIAALETGLWEGDSNA